MNEIVNFIFSPAVANDFPYAFREAVRGGFDFPQVWSRIGSGMGEYRALTLWAWPIDFLYGIGGFIGIDFSILEKALGVIPIFAVGILSILKFLEYYKVGKFGRIVGTFFYLINTYILLIVDGGQFVIGLAYAFMPVVFLSFVKSTGGDWRRKIFAGLSISLLGFFDVRFIYILGIPLFLYFVYKVVFSQQRIYLISNWIKSILVSVFILFGINLYWILPTILVKDTSFLGTYNRVSQTSFLNFTQLKHAISLLQPHWFENVFGVIPPFRREFLLIPLLAFLAPILKRKNKEVWFWTIITIISVFLTKGANPPFPEIYPWFFTHIPGFSLFRDSTKFFFLVALSYSVLISFTIDELIKRFPKFKIIFPTLVIIYLLFLVRPVYLGKMTGTFSEPRYKDEYFSVADKLEANKSFGRIFWIPSKAPLGFSSPTHPTVEASRLESLRPFAAATVGSFETQNFIREGNYMGELFDISGIKYIAYPYFDPKRDNMSEEKVEYYNTFLAQIESLPWISKKISDIPIPVFETKGNKDKFFLSKHTYLVIGSDRIYTEIKDLGAKFSNNALVFIEESSLVNQIKETIDTKFILYNKSLLDLTISLVDSDKFVSPSSLLELSPNQTGWWKREAVDLVWMHDFLQQKYGIDNLDFDYEKGWAISEGENELSLNSPLFIKGNILFARVMQSSQAGEVNFYQGEQLVGSINTKIERPEKISIKLTGNKDVPDRFYQYDKADFHWIRIGEMPQDGSLTIRTKGAINIVNSLVTISPDEEKSFNKKTMDLVGAGRVAEWDKLKTDSKKDLLVGENEAKVSYQVLAPTHYKVKVEGMKAPTTLFFSETFDDGWELNGQKGYKLYSLINGFWVDSDGEYDLYFTPQKYVIPGLIVSIITLTSCIMVLVWKKSKKSS